jgi:hypothetical protein
MSQDIGLIIAIVGTGMAMTGIMIAMMYWCRGEANTIRAEAKEDRKDLMQISRNLEITINAIQVEMKDFHNKLFEIRRNSS